MSSFRRYLNECKFVNDLYTIVYTDLDEANMSYAAIAKSLKTKSGKKGTSRANAKQITNKAVQKIYKKLKGMNPEYDSADLFLGMAKEFGVEDEQDLKEFFANLSKDQREEVKQDLISKYPNLKKAVVG